MSTTNFTEINPLWIKFIKLVKAEVIPAIGCTEPISLAFAAALAAKKLGKTVERIEAKVSANLMKNGMGVTVPGTGTVGLAIAAAVGAIAGDPMAKLEVLNKLTPEHVVKGKQMIAEKRVQLSTVNVNNILYAEAKVFNGQDWVKVCIADDHTNVVKIEQNGEIIFQAEGRLETAAADSSDFIKNICARDVFDFAEQVPLDMISFISEAGRINDQLSHAGMNGDYGLHIGATFNRQILEGLMSDGIMTNIIMRTTAASDARMGGAPLPAVINSGSGNQGIVATMPVVVVAEYVKASEEDYTRALMLSHMMAIYIHSKLPKLSALCAVTTAAMGAAAGMAWLFKKDFNTITMVISNMIGDVSGMICDGAANSCAMKVSTAAGAAYKAVLMALEGIRVTGNEGIVAECVDDSIANLGMLATRGMLQTDNEILEIMLKK